MDKRQEARIYFQRRGLHYSDINELDIYRLIQLLNKEIYDSKNSTVFMVKEIKFRKFGIEKTFNEDKTLHFIEIRVMGSYFKDREAFTFNTNGFIAIANWADSTNLEIFTAAFKKWCDYLCERKENSMCK